MYSLMQKKPFKIIIFILIFLCIIATAILVVKYKSITQQEEYQAYKDELERRNKSEEKITVLSNEVRSNPEAGSSFSAYDVLSGNADGKVLITPKQFSSSAQLRGKYSFGGEISANMFQLKIDAQSTDIFILQFCAWSEDERVTMDIACDDIVNTIYLGKEPTMFYIPISNIESLDSISFTVTSDYHKTYLDSVYLINYGNSYPIAKLTTGAFCQDGSSVIKLNEKNKIIDQSVACLLKDNYIFSLYNGKLTCYQKAKKGQKPTIISELSGMGIGNISKGDMAFNKDNTAIIISARQSGMYIVDITEPAKMKLISHYDTLEAVAGLAVRGNYVFLCSRYYGVEFVDISDMKHPVFVNKVADNKEYQDCFVDGDYLYVSVYAEKCMAVYNIHDLNHPQKVSEFELDGSGHGCYVSQNILYVATALNSGRNKSTDLSDYGKGTGNGMEIYDVSNPAKPVHLSTVKTNGRMNISEHDIWDVQISNGFAYLSDMYNGLYVYDVSDPANPVCKTRFQVSVNEKSNLYKRYDDQAFAIPYNTWEENRACVYHVSLDHGKIYMVTQNMGVYCLDLSDAKPENPFPANHQYVLGEKNKKELKLRHYFASQTDDYGGCSWAVAVKNNDIYVAAGEAGIQKLNSSMQVVESVPCKYSVRDVKIFDNYLFTAENEGGIGIYRLGKKISKISTLDVTGKNIYISQIVPTKDGKYLIAQTNDMQHMIVNIKDPNHPTIQSITDITGPMTSRNIITNLINQKYVGIFGREKICWYSSEKGKLTEADMDNAFNSPMAGMCAYDDYCIRILNGGYLCFDVTTKKESGLITLKNIELNGKCIAFDNLLVVSSVNTGQIDIVDISDITKPKSVESFSIDGNPDIAYISDDYILIPCRYGGLLKLEKIK